MSRIEFPYLILGCFGSYGQWIGLKLIMGCFGSRGAINAGRKNSCRTCFGSTGTDVIPEKNHPYLIKSGSRPQVLAVTARHPIYISAMIQYYIRHGTRMWSRRVLAAAGFRKPFCRFKSPPQRRKFSQLSLSKKKRRNSSPSRTHPRARIRGAGFLSLSFPTRSPSASASGARLGLGFGD
jgi:hypothetical protein